MREKRTTAAILITLLAITAAGIAGYLAWKTLNAEPVAGCGLDGGGACDDVLASRWSRWLGAPVSLPAVGVYGAFIAAAWAAALRPGRVTVGVLTALAVATLGAGAWFVGVQAIELEAYCPWCLTAHACGAVASLLSFYLVSNANELTGAPAAGLVGVAPRSPRRPRKRPSLMVGTLVGTLLGTAGVGALIAGQVLVEEEPAGMQSIDIAAAEPDAGEPAHEPSDSDADGEGPGAAGGDDRPFELAPIELVAEPDNSDADADQNRVFKYVALSKPVRVDKMPLLGSATAANVVVEVVDYTCPHCRKLAPFVDEAIANHRGKLAFVIHHLPLNSECNPHVPDDARKVESHRHACEYARLAISVWLGAPEEFPDYHNWLMTGDEPPRITRARVRAADLIGDDVLIDDSLRYEVVDRIKTQCAQFKSLKGGLPVLLFRYDSVQGVPKSAENFEELLQQKLQL